MRAKIIMVFDEGEFEYGTYPFETNEQKNRVSELATQIREERRCCVYVKPVEEKEC